MSPSGARLDPIRRCVRLRAPGCRSGVAPSYRRRNRGAPAAVERSGPKCRRGLPSRPSSPSRGSGPRPPSRFPVSATVSRRAGFAEQGRETAEMEAQTVTLRAYRPDDTEFSWRGPGTRSAGSRPATTPLNRSAPGLPTTSTPPQCDIGVSGCVTKGRPPADRNDRSDRRESAIRDPFFAVLYSVSPIGCFPVLSSDCLDGLFECRLVR